MRRRPKHLLLVCGLLLAGPAGAEELLKPVSGPGAGPAVQGLQATVRAVKEDFGPGESVLIQWTLANKGDRQRTVDFDRASRTYSLFRFEARRNGQPVELKRVPPPAPDERKHGTLAPGGQVDQWIDLRGLSWTDQKWLDPRGAYEVVVVYTGAEGGPEVRSGWAAFRIANAGTPLPVPTDPVEVERIRGLITQLGADDFDQRESAQKALLEVGEKAVGLLTEALTATEDPEIRVRCQQLIDRINQLRIQRRLAAPLCAACQGKAFTTDVGQCKNCGGPTPSRAWTYCRECAARLDRCAACGKALHDPPPPPPPPNPVPMPPQPGPIPVPPPVPPPQPPPQPPPLPPLPPPDDF